MFPVDLNCPCTITSYLSFSCDETTSCLEAPDKDKEEIQEVTSSLAAAKEVSLDVAVVAVLSELDGFFTLRGGQKWH